MNKQTRQPNARKRGVTLVELTVTLALMLIVGGIAGNVIYTSAVQYSNALALNNAKAAVDTMQAFMADTLRYVEGPVHLTDDGSGPGLFTSGGVLLQKKTGAAPVDFMAAYPGVYANLEYTVYFSRVGDDSVQFHYSVRRPGKDPLYETQTTLHLLNATVTGATTPVAYLRWAG